MVRGESSGNIRLYIKDALHDWNVYFPVFLRCIYDVWEYFSSNFGYLGVTSFDDTMAARIACLGDPLFDTEQFAYFAELLAGEAGRSISCELARATEYSP